jgi:gluconate 2-dehydrogenase alpha chain
MATQIDDFNGDNFDHTGLGFIGGAGINALSNTGLPIGLTGSLPKGTPQWGKDWKKAFQHSYQNFAAIQGRARAIRIATSSLISTRTTRIASAVRCCA